jgi:hypothetical protein
MPAKIKNLSGQVFGYLIVLDKYETRKCGRGTRAFWLCRCVCGKEIYVRGTSLSCGDTKSCGCKKNESISKSNKEAYNKKERKFRVDHSGEKFGYLTILDKYKRAKSGKSNIGKWLCQCICGKEVWKQYSSLRSGVKSCGCMTAKMQSDAHRLPYGEAAFNCIYGQYKNRAKCKKKIKFSLDKKTFRDIISSNCYYCGGSPSNKCVTPENTGEFIYNGVDRIDNNKGYVPKNCVPCCKRCNRAKDIMSEKEFLFWVKDIYNYRAKKIVELL